MEAKVKVEKINEKEFKVTVESDKGEKIELTLSNFDEQFLSSLVSKFEKTGVKTTNNEQKPEEGFNLLCNLIGCSS